MTYKRLHTKQNLNVRVIIIIIIKFCKKIIMDLTKLFNKYLSKHMIDTRYHARYDFLFFSIFRILYFSCKNVNETNA